MRNLELAAAFAGWLALVIVLLTNRRSRGPAAERRRGSMLGIVFQGLAFGAVWAHRPGWDPHADLPSVARLGLLVIATILLGLSIWFVAKAIGTLGKQWSFVATVRPDHALVTTGPYRYVRHPIYSGMFGMLVGTGLLLTSAPRFFLAVVLFLTGTSIRVRVEEQLLRSRFGGAYDDYAARVHAVFPSFAASRMPRTGGGG